MGQVSLWNVGMMEEWNGEEKFSTVWKTFFHSVEKFAKSFPWCGKNRRKSSTVWKTFFHSVENHGITP
jgi:hypothetical protein